MKKKFEPLFIKDSRGKTKEVYIDLASYKRIVKKIEKYCKVKISHKKNTD